MARRMRASSGGSSHNGGGKPGRMGGRMGVRKSFGKQYFSSMRSVTHGGTGMGVQPPIEKGWLGNEACRHPPAATGATAAAAISTRVRTFLIPLSLPAEVQATDQPSPPRRKGILAN